jgi:hypothetical protein
MTRQPKGMGELATMGFKGSWNFKWGNRAVLVMKRNFFRLRGDPLEGKQTEFEDSSVPWKSSGEEGNEGEEDDDMF